MGNFFVKGSLEIIIKKIKDENMQNYIWKRIHKYIVGKLLKKMIHILNLLININKFENINITDFYKKAKITKIKFININISITLEQCNHD